MHRKKLDGHPCQQEVGRKKKGDARSPKGEVHGFPVFKGREGGIGAQRETAPVPFGRKKAWSEGGGESKLRCVGEKASSFLTKSARKGEVTR